MKKEKLILSFVAVLFGLFAAGTAFYLFQSTKIVTPTNSKTIIIASPTPPPPPAIFLTVDRPKDEEVVKSKILVISGKTSSNAVVSVITDSSEDVITPTANGDFSTTVTIGDNQNIIQIISIAPNGESVTIKKTVTYSQEEF